VSREHVVILVCAVAGGSMVVAADLSHSYIPLFVGWFVFGAMPWLLSRMERRRS
jgi:hypothetical protein